MGSINIRSLSWIWKGEMIFPQWCSEKHDEHISLIKVSPSYNQIKAKLQANNLWWEMGIIGSCIESKAQSLQVKDSVWAPVSYLIAERSSPDQCPRESVQPWHTDKKSHHWRLESPLLCCVWDDALATLPLNFWTRPSRFLISGAFYLLVGFPCGSASKESACNAGDLGSIPGLGRSPGEGKGYPLQYSGLDWI